VIDRLRRKDDLMMVPTVSTEEEITQTLLTARQLILWRVVEQLNVKPVNVDSVRSLAASYNLLSRPPGERFYD
jgi:hypothetical protein